jgi:hypothetical protein
MPALIKEARFHALRERPPGTLRVPNARRSMPGGAPSVTQVPSASSAQAPRQVRDDPSLKEETHLRNGGLIDSITFLQTTPSS